MGFGNFELLGDRIRICRPVLADAEARFRWFADPAVTEFLPLAGERIIPMESVVEFLSDAIRDDNPNLGARIALRSGPMIGCGGLREIEPARSAEISVVIGERELWGQGYGQEAMTLLLRYGFQSLDLKNIWLIVRTDNSRGVRLFSRLGFVVTETRTAAAIVGGVPRDKFRMELSRDSAADTVLK